MMQDVPKADVVVTNPTHFAVALRYERGTSAPKVVAKGQDEIAATHPRRSPASTKSPWSRTSRWLGLCMPPSMIGREIPPDLFEAVAQVLAFVYRTHGRRK